MAERSSSVNVSDVRARRKWTGLATTLFVVAFAPTAHADDKLGCADAAERAQSLRDEGRLLDARKDFMFCAQDACPRAVARECVAWAEQVAEATPSIAVAAVDPEGRDVADAAIVVDGERRRDTINGRPIELDPGEHRIRLERAGYAPSETTLVLQQGERARLVRLTLAPLAVASAAPNGEPSAAAREARVETPAKPLPKVPVASWVLGGVGAAGMATFLIAGLSGASRFGDLSATCAPNCVRDDVQSVRTRFLIADIGLATGLVAFGAAAAIWLWPRAEENRPKDAATSSTRRHERRPGPAAVTVTPWVGRAEGGASVVGSF
jgi:hypothetical protein